MIKRLAINQIKLRKQKNNKMNELLYAFKTPTVRNTAITAPYMHNGVYKSLNEVILFYQRGGGTGIGITLPNQSLPFDTLVLSADDKDALLAFLNTLSDK
jgi:cytochrome c peroxidase